MEELILYPGVVSTVEKMQLLNMGVVSTVESVQMADVGVTSTVESVQMQFPGFGVEKVEGSMILLVPYEID